MTKLLKKGQKITGRHLYILSTVSLKVFDNCRDNPPNQVVRIVEPVQTEDYPDISCPLYLSKSLTTVGITLRIRLSGLLNQYRRRAIPTVVKENQREGVWFFQTLWYKRCTRPICTKVQIYCFTTSFEILRRQYFFFFFFEWGFSFVCARTEKNWTENSVKETLGSRQRRGGMVEDV